ncbi:MAG: photosynthetic reaction center cytochrome c subunit, partial [Gemmatimonadaceae bacterium]|nr:photosynthetic reaction center cytochrome c subunit [Gemmatimonadaceae bacterium]
AQGPGGGPPPWPPGGPLAAATDTAAPRRDSLVALLRASIAGKEQMPAESVFKNIQKMKGQTAGRLVGIMAGGYSRSLGVSCEHCHDVKAYDSDDKAAKNVARGMMDMTAMINTQVLPSIKGIQSQRAFVNCGTCHRGFPRPGVNPGGNNRPAP